MIIAPELVLKDLMTKIVGATHGLTDTAGNPQTMSTIAEAQLRMAAICALQIATGMPVWPGDRKIQIVRRAPTTDIFEEARG